MATTIPNYEEAATVATESISNLDNLPNEVQHILNEINHLEKRCQDLQNEIARDQRRYIRDAIRPSGVAPSFPFSPGAENGGGGSALARANAPRRIATSYNELNTLSSQKILLAERLIELLTRAQAKLDADVSRVRVLQGEPPIDDRRRPEPQFAINSAPTPAHVHISENLRNALNGTTDHLMLSIDAGAVTPSAGTSSHVNKKRRLNNQPSVKVTAPAATAASTTAAAAGGGTAASSTSGGGRSRPARQASTKQATLIEEQDDEDLDAEGEDEFEGDEGEEDPTLYCFCQKRSYGDMIGCDNSDCPYQWFHISCVGVKTPLPDKWYCPDCIKSKAAAPEKRKGRKK